MDKELDRRRSLAITKQTVKSRRLSVLSAQSLALTVEIKKDQQRANSQDSSEVVVVVVVASLAQLSFVTKICYTIIMLTIHFNFVSFINFLNIILT